MENVMAWVNLPFRLTSESKNSKKEEEKFKEISVLTR
jgi:hypothetical protein